MRKATKLGIRWSVIALLTALGGLATAGEAFAATNVNVTVTTAGIGVTGCSLQEAVVALNGGATNGCTLSGTGTPRTAILGANTYQISDRLVPTRAMTIRGSGAGAMGTTFIRPTSGFTSDAAIYIQTSTADSAFDVTLQDLTLRRTSGSASISGVKLQGYWEGFPDPSGPGPSIILVRARISGFNNSGIYSSFGNIHADDSIIENNSSPADGAGILLLGDPNTNRILRMFRSLIRNNLATWSGGGVYFHGGNNSRIEHTTIAQNAAFSGGGIFSQPPGLGYLDLQYDTIAENDAFSGGGIYCNVCDARVTVNNSVIANNTGAQGFDLDGVVNSAGSLWSYTDGLDQAWHEFDMLDVDPMLGVFQDLGGNVADLNADGVIDGMMGYQPFKGSPVLDYAFPDPGNAPRDQRSFLRGKDSFGSDVPGWDDIGAFEQGPWEIERIPLRQVSGFGATHTILTDATNYSDGRAGRLRGTATGAFATYRIPVSELGTYSVRVKVRKGSSGAQAKLQWSNSASGPWTDVGTTQEFYQMTTSYVEITLTPSISLSPNVGQKYFRWLITGKQTASSNWDVVTDYIKLIKQ